jgi:hypothetical protein
MKFWIDAADDARCRLTLIGDGRRAEAAARASTRVAGSGAQQLIGMPGDGPHGLGVAVGGTGLLDV